MAYKTHYKKETVDRKKTFAYFVHNEFLYLIRENILNFTKLQNIIGNIIYTTFINLYPMFLQVY